MKHAAKPADPADVTAGVADDALPLALSVGFTGHRTLPDAAAAEAGMAAAFAVVAEAFDQIAANVAAAYQGAPRLRLLVGAAPGADRRAANAWRAGRHGETHYVYPFRDTAAPRRAAYTDDPAKDDADTRVTPPAREPWTGFDATSLGLAGSQPHTEVAHWLIRHSDVLVAFWDGEAGRGRGGVNDTVVQALERELPVIWLHAAAPPRLIDPSCVRRHADAVEALAHAETHAAPLEAAALAALLAEPLTPPSAPNAAGEDPETDDRVDYAVHDPLRHPSTLFGTVQRLFDRTVWRTYRRFERIAGRAAPAAHEPEAIPRGMDRQGGFIRLLRAEAVAGERANYLASIHRSEQLLLIAIAIVAVFVGVLPAVFGGPAWPHFHIGAAFFEFTLGALALTISRLARRARRHRRWSDARRLAERLRAAVATWPLGFDIGDHHAEAPRTWTEWRARAVVRAAGPTTGWITKQGFVDALGCARARLIESQSAYHARQMGVAENIEKLIRAVEGFAFGLLMGALGLYLSYGLAAWLGGWPAPSDTLDGVVIVISAVSPAVGAGCLALDATNGYAELAEHSRAMAGEFGKLEKRLGDPRRAAYHHGLAVIRHAAQILVDDADAWRDRLLRRRIIRGA